MKTFILILIVTIFSVSASAGPLQTIPTVTPEPIHVVLLNPGGNHWFWKMVIDFMKAAADDLGMQLEVVTSDRDHLLTIQQVGEVVKRANPPDYIITGNEKSNAGEIIRIADQAGVKIFLFSNGFVDSRDIELYGRPRGKCKNWIGELIPNNFSAGYKMGKMLIDRALTLGLAAQDGKVHIAAIAGTYRTHASLERVKGLRQAVEEYGDQVKLLQVFHGNWTSKKAEEISTGLFRRYQEVGVVWGVNDSTALGAMNVAESLGKIPGKDILFGGCGWYSPAIQKIQEGTLVTSVGGHFMEGGWVMVLLHDYHHGTDFLSEQIETAMFSIDKSNVDQYLEVFGEQEWHKLDFKKFSKIHNRSLEKYDFSLDTVLKQFKKN